MFLLSDRVQKKKEKEQKKTTSHSSSQVSSKKQKQVHIPVDSRESRSPVKKKTASSRKTTPTPIKLITAAEPGPAMQNWVKKQMSSQMTELWKLIEKRLPAQADSSKSSTSATQSVPPQDSREPVMQGVYNDSKQTGSEGGSSREQSPVKGLDVSKGFVRMRSYDTDDEEDPPLQTSKTAIIASEDDKIDELSEVDMNGHSFDLDGDHVEVNCDASDSEFANQQSEQDFDDFDELPDQGETKISEGEANLQKWRNVILDVAARNEFTLPQSAPEVSFPGDSPTRRSTIYCFPPSAFQKSHLKHVSAVFNKDMSDKPKYRNVFPRPPKFSKKFLLDNEELQEHDKTPRPQINAGFNKLLSCKPNVAGKPVGFCNLSAADTKALESAAAWQKRQLQYQDILNGNARTLLKRVLQDSEKDDESPLSKKQHQEVSMAFQCLDQSQMIAKQYTTPTACYIDARLQTGRRDTYLNRLDEHIPVETMIKIRGSRFAERASDPLFDPDILKDAAQELADYRLAHPEEFKKSTYVKHTMLGSKTPRDRLQNFKFSDKKRRYNNSDAQSDGRQAQSNRGGRGGGNRGGGSRGAGNNNKRGRGGNNRGKK